MTPREVVARALWDLLRNHGAFTAADWATCVKTSEERPDTLIGSRVAQHQIDTDAALAALAQADGLAEVLRGHRLNPPTAACQCGARLTLTEDGWAYDMAPHLAGVVRGWIGGRA